MGAVSVSNRVSVFPDPTTMVELWKDSPQGLVKEGDTVKLRCQGDGSPPPSFIFNREQVRMNERERERRHDGMFFICRTVRTSCTRTVEGLGPGLGPGLTLQVQPCLGAGLCDCRHTRTNGPH